ncbi:hypothetical protein SEHO0A_00748 [Salmonella enterica subsp. houtenae str. ATCC BAA-1581]|nr:hypothetical protein SEHO0A_00748 [Salmonella enterica subsp. houtenae str. ATCC BAA-1581]
MYINVKVRFSRILTLNSTIMTLYTCLYSVSGMAKLSFTR